MAAMAWGGSIRSARTRGVPTKQEDAAIRTAVEPEPHPAPGHHDAQRDEWQWGDSSWQ